MPAQLASGRGGDNGPDGTGAQPAAPRRQHRTATRAKPTAARGRRAEQRHRWGHAEPPKVPPAKRQGGIPTARSAILDIGTLFRHYMLSATSNSIKHNLRRKVYPDGSADFMVATAQIFREPGWEDALDKPKVKTKASPSSDAASSLERAKRRARSAVADLALSNDFKYFVTFTLDASKVDRYDPVAVTKKLNSWLDNRVRRDGLKYVLVPELHKDGAIHFHGFVNDALEAIDSGTVSVPGQKPKKPRSAKIRAQMLSGGGHIVYNLPQWTLGFTTAIELYGAKRQAVGYVTKYITKAQTKVGGRWYYHGGDLKLPIVDYDDVDYNDFIGKEGSTSFDITELGVSVIKFTYTKEET